MQQAVFGTTSTYPPVVDFTVEQDHQHMIDQLDIKALRSGTSGDEKAPNPANYDKLLTNPYSKLPEVLSLKIGKR